MPGTIYNTESGFTPLPVIPGVGTADSGTELRAHLTGIPPGVQISVPASLTQGSLTVVAVQPPGGGLVPVVAGAADIVYEVTAASPLLIDELTVPVAVTNLPLGGAFVRGTLAPISAEVTASATAPIPRFDDLGPEFPFGVSCAGAPALSPWALSTLTLALLGIGMVVARRSSRAEARHKSS